MLFAPIALAALTAAPSVPPHDTAAPRTSPAFSPYEAAATNDIYDLMFCDRFESFRVRQGPSPAPWQRVLFSEPPDIPGLTKLADDASQEGRVRYLAFARLREAGVPVKPKILLGVIVEVGMEEGLDTLAAYSHGRVSYINYTGKMIVVEGADRSLRPIVKRLFEASKPVVARIGPWDQPRRPPPGKGNLRLTFLVSDGLYFGEGPTASFARDAMAGPVFQEATKLLREMVAFSGMAK